MKHMKSITPGLNVRLRPTTCRERSLTGEVSPPCSLIPHAATPRTARPRCVSNLIRGNNLFFSKLLGIKLLIVLVLLLSLAPSAGATTEKDITVEVNGAMIELDQPPIIVDGRTLVPVREVFEALGCEVRWDADTSTVIIDLPPYVVNPEYPARMRIWRVHLYLTIGSKELSGSIRRIGQDSVDAAFNLDVPAMIVNGKTFVPLRAVSEAIGCEVTWSESTRHIIITGEAMRTTYWDGSSINPPVFPVVVEENKTPIEDFPSENDMARMGEMIELHTFFTAHRIVGLRVYQSGEFRVLRAIIHTGHSIEGEPKYHYFEIYDFVSNINPWGYRDTGYIGRNASDGEVGSSTPAEHEALFRALIAYYNRNYTSGSPNNPAAGFPATPAVSTVQEAETRAVAKAAADEIAAAGLTEFEQVKAAHDYIADRVDYDYDLDALRYTAYNALVRGTATCGGYTSAFGLIMDMLGIESIDVFGTVDGGYHAWNLVRIDGEWYHVDVTWNDVSSARYQYRYFLVSDTQMSAYRTWSYSSGQSTPSCSTEISFEVRRFLSR